MHLTALLPLTLLTTLTLASPIHPRAAPQASSLIAAIMPQSTSCSGAQFPSECRTASQAAPYLISAMAKYGLYTYGEIAGVLSLVGYESVDMRYKHNVSPGRVGQGTSNMQMANFNREYAESIPELKGKVTEGTSDAEVLELVMVDEYNFGSGPWFLTTKCGDDVREQLKKGTDEGFAAYMGCVGVEAGDDRLAYWTRAKTAFGL